jgi:glycosyltransferase involved in cell wall biosynthesis
MRVAIAVQGRWDAFDLTRELCSRGHDVTLLTNYPRWAVEQFGVSGDRVRSFWPHGVITRAVSRLGPRALRQFEKQLHGVFGRWAAAILTRKRWDVAYIFSGVAEESFLSLAGTQTMRFLVRESSHIRTQAELLREEEVRTRAKQDKPSPWAIAREEREYALADAIRVVSTFAYQTFIAQGIPPSKLRLISPSLDLATFCPSQAQIEARRQRILSGAPLRILNVGTFAFRKGISDTARIIDTLGTDHFEYRFVGPIAAEATRLASELKNKATFIPKQPQSRLPASYNWGDLFLLPTIEDGYAFVLAQAAAAGLLLLTTPNGSGRDLVSEGQTGWVLPIRTPEAFVERLEWADGHRPELADMIAKIPAHTRVHQVDEIAQQIEQVCAEYVGKAVAAGDG